MVAAEQIGWLNSTAEGQEDCRGLRFLDAGRSLPMVAIEAGQYLLDNMQDMGPIVSNGFDMVTRPDGGILDYHKGCGIDLAPWEFKALRRMCSAYLDGLNSGKDKFSIPPMDREN